jgi:hypothetical protein
MNIEDYSKYSFAVYGDDTKTYKEELKDLGGKYNANLKGKPGWIFSNLYKEKVEEFIYNCTPVLEKENYSLEIEKYSEKSIAVFGDTKYYKEELKELGGKYNPNLNGKAGWIFSNKNRDKLEEWVKNIK